MDMVCVSFLPFFCSCIYTQQWISEFLVSKCDKIGKIPDIYRYTHGLLRNGESEIRIMRGKKFILKVIKSLTSHTLTSNGYNIHTPKPNVHIDISTITVNTIFGTYIGLVSLGAKFQTCHFDLMYLIVQVDAHARHHWSVYTHWR